MKIITVGDIDKFTELIPPKPPKKNKKIIESIIADVKKNGDSAVIKYEKKFGGVIKGSLKVSKQEIKDSYSKVTKDQINAIKIAKKRLTKTELAVKNKLKDFVIKTDGVIIKKLFFPLSSVGCYVPGGSARYPSSLVMSVVPAKNTIKSLNQKIRNIKRKEIVQKSLEKNGFIAICKSENEIIQLANKLAPEHLEIITKKPKSLASKIRTAGLVLLGENTPSAASDYLLGSNHILPTNGFGKVRGSLSVLDFMKLGTEVESSKLALRKISKYMNALCSSEGLPNHYEAVRSRLK